MVDKNYCMSSYLAFRFIERDGVDFAQGLCHKNIKPIPDKDRVRVKTADEIGQQIERQISEQKAGNKLGILLSGGMDSAIVASYMSGCDAYTFRFLRGEMQTDELKRAEYFAKYYKLRLHYVDIDWKTVMLHLDPCMKAKCAPVHSIEPQILQAALQAKADGITQMLIGDGSDYVFGGMDGLLSQDWTFDAFVRRYTFLDPRLVLKDPVDITYAFEHYRTDGDKIDFMGFMDVTSVVESYSSYMNAFMAAGLPYCDPYVCLKMADPLNLYRVRHGEPKYLIRELMAKRYPEISVPKKNPMPRPVDSYFKDWNGVVRPEFRTDINYSKLTGNQKWQLFCLERFLNKIDEEY